MNSDIKSIYIKLKNNLKIIATPSMFDNLYISNIDKNGDEIAYMKKEKCNDLFANFFMIRLSNDINEYNLTNNDLKENAFNVLKNTDNIKEVKINFNNGNSQPFVFNKNNKLYTINNNSDLCLVLSEYDIKYKENLFV